MAILPVGIGPQEGGYQIERSLRFNSADSAYLNRTPASAGNRKTWTWSGWVKRSGLGTNQTLFACSFGTNDSSLCYVSFTTGDALTVGLYNVNALTTSAVYRDVSAWYHVVIKTDTTQATASNRMKIFVNGVQVTNFSIDNLSGYVTQNIDLAINSANAHEIGRLDPTYGSRYHNGYLTEVNFIDGSALDPTSFGEYNSETGVWQPKAYTGSYGTNGFYLDFADNSSTTALGYDAAGSNDWTPNNFSVTAGAGNDSLVDTPTNYGTDTGVGAEVRGNYATLNPLDSGSNITLSNGNLDFSQGATTDNTVRATIGMSSGKWYCEATVGSSNKAVFGIAKQSATLTNYLGSDANGWGYYTLNGNKYNNGTGTSYGATFGTGDVIGVAFDADNGTLTFYKNGTSQGTAFTGLTSGPYFFAHGVNNANGVFNFGQRPFAYTAPSGFKALCTQNLPEPTVVDGGDYFNTVTWSGASSGSSLNVTGFGFQPDFIWTKNRNDTYAHYLQDAVRGIGVGNQNTLSSNSTAAEADTAGLATSFLTDGFNINSTSGPTSLGNTQVTWAWKANGAGVSNTAGSITSTVSANTTAGFSVITYTGNGTNGATIGHGLGVTPSMIIVKSRGTTDSWGVYHTSIGNTKGLYLETTGAAVTSSAFWNNTSPTSTVFSVSNNSINNASSTNYVAYCFAPVEGYSAFGSYTGNGSTDGPFVYTGFRPKFLLVKSATTAQHWIIDDTTRNPYNITNLELYPSLSNAESSDPSYDLLSNGFKLRITSANKNASGVTYIYAAFAENPFKYSLAR